ncbi:hypothetical protein CDAR_379931 [Caerostris darwini]|nr:hypothetical protein CDAR_379931 [Caerostris darwini]
MHEQGISNDENHNAMDTSRTVSGEDLANTDFLLNHPASRRLSEPTVEHSNFNGQSPKIFQALPKISAPQRGKKHLSKSKAAVSASALTPVFLPPTCRPKKSS